MKAAPTSQKLRGGYYTPGPIAHFLAHRAIQTPQTRVLEPSCGDGSLLATAARQDAARRLHSVEIDPDEAARAQARLQEAGFAPDEQTIHVGDFFAHCQQDLLAGAQTFDVVIGNPPFIRYQRFPEASRTLACQMMQQAGLHPTRLLNAWLPFLIAGTPLLRAHGRLAMVIPAELFQVNYAAETRQFLSKVYAGIPIVTFKRLVFAGRQQEVVLLLCKKDGQQRGIRTVELEDAGELALCTPDAQAFKPLDHSIEKWTRYFLQIAEIELLRALAAHPGVTLSARVLAVDVGVVTAENAFFLLNEQQARETGLAPFTQRVVARSAHLRGSIFAEEDWQYNLAGQLPTYLLAALATYVAGEEQAGYHQGYTCRVRTPWYVLPSVWNPDAFLLRQIHSYPKLILNRAQATCTDTLHRVRFCGPQDSGQVVAAFLNVLTFAFAEVTGRGCGGGVLTFEPGEAERLPLPLSGAQALDLAECDRLLGTDGVEAVLVRTDDVLLKHGLGLADREVRMLHTIWAKLRDRRILRRQRGGKR
ncbi:MAG TPA: class I SAM-dependent methyltransferase [Ktedonobacteraceae bacterium]|jgi:adenine-specific DNA-methyltransferase